MGSHVIHHSKQICPFIGQDKVIDQPFVVDELLDIIVVKDATALHIISRSPSPDFTKQLSPWSVDVLKAKQRCQILTMVDGNAKATGCMT